MVVHNVLETVLEPADALIQAGSNATLLVLGSRGRGNFGRLLLGSTAHAVLTRPPWANIIQHLRNSEHKK